jgi:rhomboid family GlyGly-CTERM serine protease
MQTATFVRVSTVARERETASYLRLATVWTRCRLTIVITVLTAAIGLVPNAALRFEFHREAIAAGELWRLLTGHLAHWNLDHLFWDLTVFAVIGGWCEWRDRSRFVVVLLGAGLLISSGIWVIHDEIVVYRGLSGLDSALFALLLMNVLRDQWQARKWKSILAIGGLMLMLVAKIGYETITGTTLFVDSRNAGFIPLPLAHLVGALVGGLFGALFSAISDSGGQEHFDVIASCKSGLDAGANWRMGRRYPIVP